VKKRNLLDHTYLAKCENGDWAVVYPSCPTCGAKCDKSHSGIIEFCCGHSFYSDNLRIKGFKDAGYQATVDGKPAFMFVEAV
jgi:hypothetical protein